MFGGTGASFARRVTSVAVAILVVFRFVTVIAPVGDAFGLFVHGPAVATAGTDGTAAARRAPNRTGHALVPFFVPEESIRTGVEATSFVREPAGSAQDALRFGRTIARHAGRMTIGTIVVFGFVSVLRAGRIAFVLMHN